jgi:4-hydroxybenzoate polyprenyltransferase
VRTVVGLIRASHPFPVVAVVALTALIGVASAADEVDGGRLARVVLAMFCAQLLIGWSNDFLDQDDDALYQPDKPIPSGELDLTWKDYPLLPGLAALAGVIGIAVVMPLGWVTAVCYFIGAGAGQAYNFWLKPTAFSWLPFVVAFCVLPPFVWTGLDIWQDEFAWLYVVALPLTVAVHLANTLPDLETDRAAGRRSVAVVLGRRRATVMLAVLLSLPVGLVALSSSRVSYEAGGIGATALGYAAVLALAAGISIFGRGRRDYSLWAFRLIVVASLVFVAGWLVSVK